MRGHLVTLSLVGGRKTYCDEVREKIESGSNRLKKRSKAVKRKDSTQVKNSFKGQFMGLDDYKKDLLCMLPLLQMHCMWEQSV